MNQKSDKLLAVAAVVVISVSMLGLVYFFAGTGAATTASFNEVKLVVNYSGDWRGTIVNGTIMQKVNGTGPETFYIIRATNGPINGTINAAAFVIVTDDNIGYITVSIEKMDGAVIQRATENEGGMASINWID